MPLPAIANTEIAAKRPIVRARLYTLMCPLGRSSRFFEQIGC
jgi:hypothetical protein